MSINDTVEVLQVSLSTLFYCYSAAPSTAGAILSVVVNNIISLFLLSGLEVLLLALGKVSNANEDALPDILQQHLGAASFLVGAGRVAEKAVFKTNTSSCAAQFLMKKYSTFGEPDIKQPKSNGVLAALPTSG